MRPIELLEDKEGSVRLKEIVEELKEDDEVETALEPLVREYFDTLNDHDMIEYNQEGTLFDARNRSLQKNGCSYQEIEKFVDSFSEDY